MGLSASYLPGFRAANKRRPRPTTPDRPIATQGLAALAEVDDDVPRREAVAAYLHEKNGDLELAARLYAGAARNAPNLAERHHLARQAARINQRERSGQR